MRPESKPLSIPDFNPLLMRTIQILTLTTCCLLISFYSYSQNLQFNSAVFNEYGGGQATGDLYHNIVTTGVLTVGANQVLKITSAGGSVGLPDAFYPLIAVTINDKTICSELGGPIELYLPAGSYQVGFTDTNTPVLTTGSGWGGEVKGYISGVLYDIVP